MSIDILQFLAQAAQRAVQPRLCGSQRDAQRSRHVGQLQIVTEAERQQRSIVGVEMAHGLHDLVTLSHPGRAVGGGRRFVEAERRESASVLAPAGVDGR